MARNQLGALLVRVREEAVAMQDYRGILFVLEPTTDRVLCVCVQPASNVDYQIFSGATVFLDAEPNRDTVTLPVGVRLQTMYNGLTGNGLNGGGQDSSQGKDDRYMGFNPMIPQTPGSQTPANQRYYGGCILFDANGNLVVKPYALQLAMPNPAGGSAVVSRLGVFLGADQPTANPSFSTGTGLAFWTGSGNTASQSTASSAIVPGCTNRPDTGPYVVSQLGLVLFDGDAFKTLGFTDDDADLSSNSQTYNSAWPASGISEQAEEAWLDNNSTPVMINRFDGVRDDIAKNCKHENVGIVRERPSRFYIHGNPFCRHDPGNRLHHGGGDVSGRDQADAGNRRRNDCLHLSQRSRFAADWDRAAIFCEHPSASAPGERPAYLQPGYELSGDDSAKCHSEFYAGRRVYRSLQSQLYDWCGYASAAYS
jgi:hypothetical protein